MFQKFTLLAIFSFLLAGSTFAQFTIAPVPSSVSGNAGELLKSVATITNTSGTTLNLQWERITNNLEPGWSTAICDPIACRAPFVDTETFTLDPSGALSSGTFSAWFTTTSEGTGYVELKVWVVGDSINTVQFNNYTATAGTPTSLDEVYADILNVYPNPATTFINLPDHQDVASAVLYSVTGKKMKSFELGNGFDHKVYIGDLPRGMYLVQFMDNNGEVLHTAKFARQ